jgi:FlaA1/EpsC-like NDP-sugar epimerase
MFKAEGPYDYILNLSALKHVRSEKDEFTLMRLINVNIFNTEKTLLQARDGNVRKYFCVSTDKAANPVNMMGASKRIMEMYLMRRSKDVKISTARFANVAFSDGSLLHGFNQRIQKGQPIAAPNDIKRYFVTPQESGELCLMSCIFGENRDIFFPKLSENLHLITFADIATKYLKQLGYQPHLCESEEEARTSVESLKKKGKYPCFFFNSDTTGEKDFEEFFTDNETLDMESFENLGIIKNDPIYNEALLNKFTSKIEGMKKNKAWTKGEIVNLFNELIPNFNHKETGKYLDNKM